MQLFGRMRAENGGHRARDRIDRCSGGAPRHADIILLAGIWIPENRLASLSHGSPDSLCYDSKRPHEDLAERWLSGRKQRFAKPS